MWTMPGGFQFIEETWCLLRSSTVDVAKEFWRGNFVVHKSRRDFSALAIDHANEQN